MKKDSNILWLFPLYFFVFLAIFLSAKFIFIFFFRASYEPDFMFKLTPFHILSGFNNLQLLFLSLVVIISGMYLHLKVTKKNLTYSFIPTAFMLCGLGFSIATEEISISNILNYLIFGCLLIAILLDQKHILLFPEIVSVEKEPQKDAIPTKLAVPKARVAHASAKRKPRRISYPIVSPLFSFAKLGKKTPSKQIKKAKYVEFKEVSPISYQSKKTLPIRKDLVKKKSFVHDQQSDQPSTASGADIQYAEDMIDKIERKMEKLAKLEDELEQKKRGLVKKEETIREQPSTPLDKTMLTEPVYIEHATPLDDDTDGKDAATYRILLERIQDPAVVIQRGAFKEVSQPFADLLGYDAAEIVGKRLLDFVVPGGFSSIEKYYLQRLKGKSISGVEIMFLTKDDHKINVNLITKSITFNGEKIDVTIFKKLGGKN